MRKLPSAFCRLFVLNENDLFVLRPFRQVIPECRLHLWRGFIFGLINPAFTITCDRRIEHNESGVRRSFARQYRIRPTEKRPCRNPLKPFPLLSLRFPATTMSIFCSLNSTTSLSPKNFQSRRIA